jgi:hypothetical protein
MESFLSPLVVVTMVVFALVRLQWIRRFAASDLGNIAVHEELNPRDVAGLVGDEKRNSFGHLIGVAQSAERYILRQFALKCDEQRQDSLSVRRIGSSFP